MKRKRHVHELQHDLLTENIIPKSDSQLPTGWFGDFCNWTNTQTYGLLQASKGELLCAPMLRGEDCLLDRGARGIRNHQSIPTAIRNSWADRHCG